LTYSETPADDNDDELVRRARLGDADRFTTLVRRHQERMYRLAWRMVGPEAAEDVAQQAFLKAWLGLDQFAGASSFWHLAVSTGDELLPGPLATRAPLPLALLNHLYEGQPTARLSEPGAQKDEVRRER
jgi:hypothetical protein